MMTSSPRLLAISTVSSWDTSSTRMIWSTRPWGMSAYVRSSVLAALYAGMTTMTRGGIARGGAGDGWVGLSTERKPTRSEPQRERAIVVSWRNAGPYTL